MQDSFRSLSDMVLCLTCSNCCRKWLSFIATVSFQLYWFRASDGLWRRNAARIIIKVLLYSDQGFQVALDSGLIQTLMDLLTSNESLPLEHAFKIICGCPTIHRKRLLSSSGLQDHIVCILRYQSSYQPYHL